MRQCAKMRCEEHAVATVALRYAERVVWIRDLLPQHDPNLLDLCVEHANEVPVATEGAGPVTVADRLPA
jgi:hypothetical protein